LATLTMGDKHFHIAKAERNEKFYQTYELNKSQFNEWAVVVLFYVSMHYIDAVLYQDTLLSNKMRNPKNHKTRNSAISQCSKLAQIYPMYSSLRDRCWEARYHKINFPDDYFINFATRVFEPTRVYLRRTLELA
jgi:hypothetical protein